MDGHHRLINIKRFLQITEDRIQWCDLGEAFANDAEDVIYDTIGFMKTVKYDIRAILKHSIVS